MKFMRYLYVTLLFAILAPHGFGCAAGSNIGRVTVEPNMLTIEELYENWEKYYVYVSYFGASESRPYGIMFDPRNDDRKLEVHNWWSRVEDQEQMSTIRRMLGTRQFPIYVWVIRSPDKKTYGYLYAPHQDVLVSVVDEKTLWVDRLWPSAFDLWYK